jgi:hypothetical protein
MRDTERYSERERGGERERDRDRREERRTCAYEGKSG